MEGDHFYLLGRLVCFVWYFFSFVYTAFGLLFFPVFLGGGIFCCCYFYLFLNPNLEVKCTMSLCYIN